MFGVVYPFLVEEDETRRRRNGERSNADRFVRGMGERSGFSFFFFFFCFFNFYKLAAGIGPHREARLMGVCSGPINAKAQIISEFQNPEYYNLNKITNSSAIDSRTSLVRKGKMVLSNFSGGGVGFGFGVGCGFGVGWGFGGAPLNILGLGAGGGCGVGLGLGWGFGAAYGSRYYSPGLTFQGVEFDNKSSEEKDAKSLVKNK